MNKLAGIRSPELPRPHQPTKGGRSTPSYLGRSGRSRHRQNLVSECSFFPRIHDVMSLADPGRLSMHRRLFRGRISLWNTQ